MEQPANGNTSGKSANNFRNYSLVENDQSGCFPCDWLVSTVKQEWRGIEYEAVTKLKSTVRQTLRRTVN